MGICADRTPPLRWAAMETPTLAEALLNVINDYIEEEELSLAEVLGSLELVKADLLRQAEEDEFDDDDEDADLNKGRN